MISILIFIISIAAATNWGLVIILQPFFFLYSNDGLLLGVTNELLRRSKLIVSEREIKCKEKICLKLSQRTQFRNNVEIERKKMQYKSMTVLLIGLLRRKNVFKLNHDSYEPFYALSFISINFNPHGVRLVL